MIAGEELAQPSSMAAAVCRSHMRRDPRIKSTARGKSISFERRSEIKSGVSSSDRPKMKSI